MNSAEIETEAKRVVINTYHDCDVAVLQVRDENDETPVFSKTLYQARVSESSPLIGRASDVYVTTVKASDADVGDNARLSYRVIDDPRNEFRVLDNGTVLAVRGELHPS